MLTWQEVEQQALKLAESVWALPASPERESGVKADIIIKHKPNYWILIEVSKRAGLDKLREDLAKFSVMRPALMSKGIFSECFFITEGDESSLRESALALNVEAYSLKSFANKFLGSDIYSIGRSLAPFGSAVNPDSGTIDQTKYTPIEYTDSNSNRYSVSDICSLLSSGKRIVLTGEFGTGKSRCIMEVFNNISSRNFVFPPIAINLRDNWGYRKFSHIVHNHLDALGLGEFADSLVRSLRRANHILLLDGFDEIGSQSWSGDAARLSETRKKSLEGLRDMLDACPKAAFLITGREHYFSSDDEMLECLGISRDDILSLKCPEEFSNEEIEVYLKQNTSLSHVPDWMPRKPLICQLLGRLEKDEVERLEIASTGEVEFFESVFDAICARETRINPAIVKDVLKGILLKLAQDTRSFPTGDEKISAGHINQAFYDVAGYAPIDESAILLQRLPYLGRVGSGGADRIFIDAYACDGLRGISTSTKFLASDRSIANEKWIQPLEDLGVRVMSSKVSPNDTLNKFVKYCVNHGNHQVACDYVQLKLSDESYVCNFEGLITQGGVISSLNFSHKHIKKLSLSGVQIGRLELESSHFSDVSVEHCTIENVEGIGSADSIPEVFRDCIFGDFHGAFTISRISGLQLPDSQKTLLALIKKLFFQHGGGRQEDALLRGAEAYWDKRAADIALQYMLGHDLVVKARGDHGTLYVPRRRHTRRMARIWELQSNAHDELWDRVNRH